MQTINPAASLEPFLLEAHAAGRYAAGTTQGAVVFSWCDDAAVETVQLLAQLCEKQSAARTRPISALHVIQPKVGLPGADVRAALVAAMKRYADVLTCVGVVLLGAGFWASAMQSALVGIRILAPVGNSQLRVGASLNEVVPWLVAGHAKQTGERLSEPGLHAVAERLLSLEPRS